MTHISPSTHTQALSPYVDTHGGGAGVGGETDSRHTILSVGLFLSLRGAQRDYKACSQAYLRSKFFHSFDMAATKQVEKRRFLRVGTRSRGSGAGGVVAVTVVTVAGSSTGGSGGW